MKTVSVVIPFYSHIDWLYEAIDSVLAQTYPIHEIILVNDGSKEDMTDFLKKYGDKIIYIYIKRMLVQQQLVIMVFVMQPVIM